jgi:hypothetical protein
VFHRFVDFSSSGRNETGSPSGVLGVVVTAGNEPLPRGVVESFGFVFVDIRNCCIVNERNSDGFGPLQCQYLHAYVIGVKKRDNPKNE